MEIKVVQVQDTGVYRKRVIIKIGTKYSLAKLKATQRSLNLLECSRGKIVRFW
jgi:hypothetical protein